MPVSLHVLAAMGIVQVAGSGLPTLLHGPSSFLPTMERLPWAQALEPATWAALLKAPRGVLAGDHLQLPPTILSQQAAAKVRCRVC